MKRPVVVALLMALVACKGRDSAPSVVEPSVAKPAAGSSAAAPANDPWAKQDEAPVGDTLTKPLLWSISKDGKTSYAFGTMHVGIEPERLPKIVWDKILGATSFGMETNAVDGSLINLGARTSGSLHEDLGPDYWAKLQKLVDPQMLAGIDKKKPVIAAVFLSMRGLPRSGAGMDLALMAKAQTAGKPVVYFEPAAKQARLLERWMDVKALKLMIDTADQSTEMTKQMVVAYIAGDDKKLLALNDSMKPEALAHGYTEAEYDQQSYDMLYERNASWIPAIEEMHAKGGGFIAVGALHLVGKKSVLELLEAKGYKIERVTN